MPTPDYFYWDTVALFEIQHAAWLWFDEEPPPGAFQPEGASLWPGKILAAEGMLQRETGNAYCPFARSQKLRYVIHVHEPMAPRSLLLEVAVKLGVTPPFLFPEVRTQPPQSIPPDDVIPPHTKGTLYKLIAAIFVAYNGVIPTLDELKKDFEARECGDFDSDFLKKTLKIAAEKVNKIK